MFVAFLLLEDNMGLLKTAIQNSRSQQSAPRDTAAPAQPEADRPSADGSQLVIEAGEWGHFHLDAEISGRQISFMVDTGASMVALSQTDADTIGYPIHQLDYSVQVKTANGNARAAPVTIDEIIVGDHVISNVRGVVMEGYTGPSLLGMTFLRKLAGFEVKNNRLYLRW